MAKNSAAGLLTSLDDLFSTQEEREVAAQPRVEDIPIDLIDDFPNHPFKIRMDGAMVRLVESVGQYGVLEPCLIRPKPDGRYEMIAGHRRKEACIMADCPSIRCIVQEMTDDQAVIIMVDSNLHREEILPSEKAFAYRMKLERLLQLTDLVLLDLKHTDSDKHRELTGHDNAGILAFAQYLNDKQIPVWIRRVIVPGITDQEEELCKLGHLMAGLTNVKALEVLPYHTMGTEKYKALGIPYPLDGINTASSADAAKARALILTAFREGRKGRVTDSTNRRTE